MSESKKRNFKFLWLLIPGIILTIICIVSLVFAIMCWVAANNPGVAESFGEAIGKSLAVIFVAVFSIYGFMISAVSGLLGIPLLISGCVEAKKSKKKCIASI